MTGDEPVVTKLDHVYYWVSDMDRAVRFYQDVLGLSLANRQGDNWAVFDAGGRQFSLHRVVDGHPSAPGGATAVFAVRDLDRARALLSERGVEFGHEGDVEGYARFASFHDPDGNAVQLIEYADSDATPASNVANGGMKGSH
ncbi:MAG TPA: VOC family protein [Actinomycetota bacterium]|jgi:catechol 2,3-dioxygenase-like lactoylglutathione lyase family enzyme